MGLRPLLVLALLALGVLPAFPGTAEAVAQASDAPVPAAVTRAVAEAVASRWDVPVDAVTVEWRPGPALPAGGAVGLIGSGASGSFVARVGADGRTTGRRVRVGVRTALPVAARDLVRGDALGAGDVIMRDTLVWGPPRPIDAPVGWEVRRRIVAGAVLAPPAVAPPPAVVAGAPVRLVWSGGRLEVTALGTAAGTASTGERVAVRTEAGDRIWGVAEGPGLVRVQGRTP